MLIGLVKVERSYAGIGYETEPNCKIDPAIHFSFMPGALSSHAKDLSIFQ